jgi:two-component system sensor histidine kinase YesM
LYLTEGDQFDNVRTFQNIYQMEKDLEQSKASDLERLNILVMGIGGKHYLSRTETITATDQEIWNSRPVLLAIREPEVLHYTYSHGAYTATGRDTDVIIVSRALYYHESKEIYGVVLITLTMDELKRYYDYFITDNTTMYLVDEENRIICSSDVSAVGTMADSAWYRKAEENGQDLFRMRENGVSLTVMQKDLQYLGCRLYGVTDNDMALGRLYNMPLLILLCAAVGAVILLLCLAYTRQTLRPLSELVQRMGQIRKGDFDQYMPVEGTTEVQLYAG